MGAAGYVASEIFFSTFLKNKEGKKTEVTLSLILQFNLRLGGYSIWSASICAPYMIKISGLEHLIASEQLEVLGRLLDERPRSDQKGILTT